MLEQLDSGKTENAGVHFPDLPLGDRAQPVFDNGSHAAPVLPPLRSLGAEANDAAVASWIVKISAQHGSGGASLPVRLNQSAQRFRAQQGSVADQHCQGRAGTLLELPPRHQERVASSQLLRLLNEGKAWTLEGLPDLRGFVADHHVCTLGPRLERRPQDVFAQRLARQTVQHLRVLGLEACRLARRQEQHREAWLRSVLKHTFGHDLVYPPSAERLMYPCSRV